MQILVGTSGYSFKEWKGSFYPEKLPQKQMLNFYSQTFPTVEINNTFHKFPSANMLETWKEQVPETFQFVLKGRQTITHFRRLRNAESQVDDFVNLAAILGERMGPILFQLPPNFKKDVERLDDFLKYVDGRAKVTFEFRHESWFDEETYACLKKHEVALCVADAEDLPSPELMSTASWGYVRLREDVYTDASLRAWAKKILAMKWKQVYVFFKHEDEGLSPQLAMRFMKIAKAK